MNTLSLVSAFKSPSISRRPGASRVRRCSAPSPRQKLESLESRTLMSATFSTVDSFQLAPTGASTVTAMASDALGNVYAAGNAKDSAGIQHAVIREQLAGSAAWTTILDTTGVDSFTGIAATPGGDLLASGYKSAAGTGYVLERTPGASNFTIADQRTGNNHGLAVDGSGNAFVVGESAVTSKGKTTRHWVTRERPAGATAFTTVDDFVESGGVSFASNATVIPSGPGAGIYVVGTSDNSVNSSLVDHWVVRKSADGGQSWRTVDNFLYDPFGRTFSQPWAVAGDAAGNVYVVGDGAASYISSYNKNGSANYATGPSHWLVRKSSNGGTSWSTIDDFQLAPTALSYARAASVDAAGNLYVAGVASDGTVDHSVVRMYSSGAWTTIDNFTASPHAAARAFTIDSAGNLYSGGSANLTAGSPNTWIVRSTTPSGSTLSASPLVSPLTTSNTLHRTQ